MKNKSTLADWLNGIYWYEWVDKEKSKSDNKKDESILSKMRKMLIFLEETGLGRTRGERL